MRSVELAPWAEDLVTSLGFRQPACRSHAESEASEPTRLDTADTTKVSWPLYSQASQARSIAPPAAGSLDSPLLSPLGSFSTLSSPLLQSVPRQAPPWVAAEQAWTPCSDPPVPSAPSTGLKQNGETMSDARSSQARLSALLAPAECTLQQLLRSARHPGLVLTGGDAPWLEGLPRGHASTDILLEASRIREVVQRLSIPLPASDSKADGAGVATTRQAHANKRKRDDVRRDGDKPAEETQTEPLHHCSIVKHLFGTLLRPWWPGESWDLPLLPPGMQRCKLVGAKHSDSLAAHLLDPKHLTLTEPSAAFALYEYIEELPLLTCLPGMAHRVRAFHRPVKNAAGGHVSNLKGLFGAQPVMLNGSQPVGDLLQGRVRLKSGEGAVVMESALVHAPLFRHLPRATDFLLVRRRGQKKLVLRPINALCTVGQLEPKVEVLAPQSRQFSSLRKQCMRNFASAAWQRLDEHADADPDDIGEESALADDVSKWWRDSAAARYECREMLRSASTDPEEPLPAEQICILQAAEKGASHLRQLGIPERWSVDRSIRAAVQELEALEAQRPKLEHAIAPVARWIEEQLLLTPWHLTREIASMKGSRRLYSVSGLGDTSGNRGEAVSFLPLPAQSIPKQVSMAVIQKLNSTELRSKLLKAGLERHDFRHLGRWERMKLLMERQETSKKSGSGLSLTLQAEEKQRSGVDLRAIHNALLQETYERQVAALGSEEPDMTSSGDESSEGLAEPSTKPDLVAEAIAETSVAKASAGDEAEDRAEMQRLRATLKPEEIPATAVSQPQDPPSVKQPKKIPVLKVVTIEKNPLGRAVTRVLHVCGEDDIRRYRELQHRQQQQQAPTMGRGAEPPLKRRRRDGAAELESTVLSVESRRSSTAIESKGTTSCGAAPSYRTGAALAPATVTSGASKRCIIR